MAPRDTLEESTSRIASAIGEPARARMLFALLDGRARTSTELALLASVSPPTASAHLARLRGANLIQLHVQGRHRYYSIEDRRVAAVLERLSVLATAGSEPRATAFRPSTPPHLLHARACYDHLAGTLGVSIHDAMLERRWVARHRKEYSLTAAGRQELAALGIDVEGLADTRRRFAFGCLDWSERRPHLGGALGAAILSTMLDKRWARRERDSRALQLTTIGARELATRLGIRLALS